MEANGYSRINSIVEATLANDLPAVGFYQVKNPVSKKTAPVQRLGNGKILFVLPDTLLPGQQATYRIEKTRASKASTVAVHSSPEGLLVTVNNKKVLFYHTAVAQPPADSPAYYARSGFIHPVYSPAGHVLTDDFPAGHAHQHGIMMAWTSTQYKGVRHDFWNQQSRLGNVRHAKLLSVEQAPVMATIRLKLEHYTARPDTVLTEVWTLRVYPFSDPFLFDIESDQTNTSGDTLYLNQYHYGGMSFRGSREWNPDDKTHFGQAWKIVTDSGFSVADGNARHAAYVAAEGRVNKGYSGVAVFGFPGNFRYPQALRIHPTMPYWCYAPPVDGPFAINPLQHFVSAYRYCVYEGHLDTLYARRLLDDMQHPLQVRSLKQ